MLSFSFYYYYYFEFQYSQNKKSEMDQIRTNYQQQPYFNNCLQTTASPMQIMHHKARSLDCTQHARPVANFSPIKILRSTQKVLNVGDHLVSIMPQQPSHPYRVANDNSQSITEFSCSNQKSYGKHLANSPKPIKKFSTITNSIENYMG